MGQNEVSSQTSTRQLQAFMKALLDDVNVLEEMLSSEMLEPDARRIGAEQEMFLVRPSLRPAPVALEVLEKASDPRLTTELARFNLEANLSPRLFRGDCLRALETELEEVVGRVRDAARECDADVLLTGILPTLRQTDLGLDNMTPRTRYRELNEAMTRLRSGSFHIIVKGLDELEFTHDNVMLEACNTSFQIHFQVGPREFARLYNVAQAVTAPALAAAVNSPVLLGHRLWCETRVALFQRSVDARSSTHQARGHRPRVHFGDRWIEKSILEIFRDDIARYRVVLSIPPGEDPWALLRRGEAPPLSALRLHNGTIWRWNRACYGVNEGRGHLRIENRTLPAGPTIRDEVANAAFFFGLMSALTEEHEDIARVLDFDDAKHNFLAAARHGLKAQFAWIGGETFTAKNLILDHLLPRAHEGLTLSGIQEEDIRCYLGTLEERVRSEQTGAQWMLHSLAGLGDRGTRDHRCRTLASGMLTRQRSGQPVHRWAPVEPGEAKDWRPSYRTVGQFMSTELFTVRPGDLVDLAASIMDWSHIHHVPVEDDSGRLVGLVTQRALLRLVARGLRGESDEPVAVRDIMTVDLITVTPQTSTLSAIAIMRRHGVACLPVVEGDKLVGIVTEHDFVAVAADLFEEELREGLEEGGD